MAMLLPGSFGSGRAADRLWWAAVTMIVVGFIAWSYALLRGATSPAWQDTEAYLGHALYIAENGGLWGFLEQCFTGEFPIVERHPLYSLLLAAFASRSASFFWYAKIFDLACGLALLLSLIWMVRKRLGAPQALIAGLLYAISSSLVIASSHVNHETQFTLCVLWIWWFLTDVPAQPGVAAELSQKKRRWVIAGVLFGLAFLIKSSISLFALAFVIAGFWHLRWNLVNNSRPWLLAAAALLVASPLLVRNVIAFGTPLYEGMNAHIMWLDSWAETGSPDSVMHYGPHAYIVIEKNGLPTMSDYLAKNDAVDIGKRLVRGLVRQVTVVARKAVAPTYPVPATAAAAWGFIVLGLAVAGWWLRRRSWEGRLLLVSSAAFLVFFGWNHMFPDIRYLAPFVPIWIAFAAGMLWTLLCRVFSEANARRLVMLPCALLAIGAGAWSANALATTSPPLMEISPSYQRLLQWMERVPRPGDRILLGPTDEFYGALWLVRNPVSIIYTPYVDSIEAFNAYLRDRKVRYFVMNTENVHGQRGVLREPMAGYAEVTADGQLVEKQVLPGWRRVGVDESVPRRFYIYESDWAGAAVP